ncbi:hypothetical protein ACFQT0_24925 [Hymenobacter humi]|uniref:Uncharacterized protein n=1 Tax=Hymenobacter humi TaxID=1411620 RepID=A0ABW2UD42_9BACT
MPTLPAMVDVAAAARRPLRALRRAARPPGQKSADAREKLANQKTPSVILMEINAEDGPVLRFFKTIVRGGQLAFAAIMTFILWLVAAAAG